MVVEMRPWSSRLGLQTLFPFKNLLFVSYVLLMSSAFIHLKSGISDLVDLLYVGLQFACEYMKDRSANC
jgi:hypothetical protein